MSKLYRVVTHPDGTQCTRGTNRDRVYAGNDAAYTVVPTDEVTA